MTTTAPELLSPLLCDVTSMSKYLAYWFTAAKVRWNCLFQPDTLSLNSDWHFLRYDNSTFSLTAGSKRLSNKASLWYVPCSKENVEKILEVPPFEVHGKLVALTLMDQPSLPPYSVHCISDKKGHQKRGLQFNMQTLPPINKKVWREKTINLDFAFFSVQICVQMSTLFMFYLS